MPTMQLPLFADITPNGSGFTVTPRKPAAVVSVPQAAKILGIGRASMWYVLNVSPTGTKIIEYRYATDRKWKKLVTVESLMRYMEAMKKDSVAV